MAAEFDISSIGFQSFGNQCTWSSLQALLRTHLQEDVRDRRQKMLQNRLFYLTLEM